MRNEIDSRTCHTAVSDSRRSGFYLTAERKRNVNQSPYNCALEISVLTYFYITVGTYSFCLKTRRSAHH